MTPLARATPQWLVRLNMLAAGVSAVFCAADLWLGLYGWALWQSFVFALNLPCVVLGAEREVGRIGAPT